MPADETVTRVVATPVPSDLPGVSAWLSPVTVTPIGIGFSVYAQTPPGVRYIASAELIVDGQLTQIGGSTSADRRFSMTQLWSSISPSVLDGDDVILRLYESDGASTADRSLVRTVRLASV